MLDEMKSVSGLQLASGKDQTTIVIKNMSLTKSKRGSHLFPICQHMCANNAERGSVTGIWPNQMARDSIDAELL